ncbi:MAG TPA: Rha family transcriptional regulator [Candidatus Blautia intestinavium]|nr:Rha family transcriptional regulator [Candidatus Blautia intestinavium]
MFKIENTIDSREVADMVEKNHKDLMRDIRRYVEQLTERKIAPSDFFRESTYKDSTGRSLPCYQITKKGCEFIAHKLTGVKGTEFTARYINRFHEMEDALAQPETKNKLIGARDLAAMLKRKHCKVCYRIDSLVRQHPEYRPEFFRVFFQNSQGRMFRTYEMTEQGLRIFVALLERDGNRNSVNTVNGLNQIRNRYPALADQSSTKVSLCPRTGLKELQKAEAALEMFEQCYLGMNFADFDDEDRERFDAALCLLHDQVKIAVKEVKGAR